MRTSLLLLGLTGALLSGCGEKTPPPQPPATVSAPPPVSAAIIATPTAPAPAAAPAPATGAAPAAAPASTDALAGFRTDVDGKALSDVAILQQAVDGYNATRVRLEEPDSKPGPALTDLNQLVSLRRLPRLPAAPAGQRFVLDQKSQKVSLASQ